MANKAVIVVASIALIVIAMLVFHGHNLKRSLKESQEDLGTRSNSFSLSRMTWLTHPLAQPMRRSVQSAPSVRTSTTSPESATLR